MHANTSLFAPAFVTVLVIMDPLGNIPVFLSLTRAFDERQRRRAALQGSVVAAFVIIVFALFGERILSLLGIGLPALQAAGGLLLLIVALELLHPDGVSTRPVAPVATPDDEPDAVDLNISMVPLGTPLLAGPGAIAATMLYTRRADGPGDLLVVVAALLAVLAVIYVSLRNANLVARVLKDKGINLLSRVMGLLVAAIAVQLAAEAVQEWIRNGVH